MSPRRVATVVGVLALALWSPTTGAWTAIDTSQPTWSPYPTYRMHSAGSADIGSSASETAVRAAFDDWAGVSCTGLQVTWGGQTSSSAADNDGVNTIQWLESSWPYDQSAIGVTGTAWSTNPPTIVEADMRLNGVYFTWTTGPGSGSSVNAYSIVLHEGGHFLGLGHSSDSNATMYYAYSGGIDSLQSDDIAGICYLYPGGSTSDCTVTGCPTGETCDTGTGVCVPNTGTGLGMCAPCSDGSQCGGAADYCLQYPSGAYCGRSCSTAADCQDSPFDTCVTLSNGGKQCVRADSGGSYTCACGGAGQPSCGCVDSGDCAAGETCNTATGQCVADPSLGTLGAACTTASDCASGRCERGQCTQSCDPNVISCPGTMRCLPLSGICGEYVCLTAAAGTLALGSVCQSNEACLSSSCLNGVCVARCRNGADCVAPEECDFSSGCGVCRSPQTDLEGLGGPCALNADCESQLCVDVGAGNDPFCSNWCDSTACPAGFTCQIVSQGAICLPNDLGTDPDPDPKDGGCGCQTSASGAAWWLLLGVLFGLGLALRRRRR